MRAPGRQPRAIEIDGTRDRVIELELAPMPVATTTTTAAPAARASETTAATRRNAREDKARARDGRKRGAGESGRRGGSRSQRADRHHACRCRNSTPTPTKPNPAKPAHTSYDEM